MPASPPAIDSSLPRLGFVTSKARVHAADLPLEQDGVTFQNWAQTFTCKPERFFRPRNTTQVIEIVKKAASHGRHVTVVGAGHSPGDIACTDDYMVSLDLLSNLLHIEKSLKRVKVQAGMRLYQLHHHLESHGLGMSNLGSISEQSIGGFLATATHGSSLNHSILSQLVVSITIVLADGTVSVCSESNNQRLFRAALVSLGAIGIIVDVTFQVSTAFDVKSSKSIVNFDKMLNMWGHDKLWQSAEFVRVWWFPYSKKTVVWQGHRIEADSLPHATTSSWYKGTFWAYHLQQALLYAGRFVPSAGPSIERAVFTNQYGSQEGEIAQSIERSYVSLNMNCLFSQYVNEWSIPLENGIEACRRLDLWLAGNEKESGIPYSSKGIFVHAPIEIRVAGSYDDDAWLSTAWGGPTCYIGVIMYKPFYQPVPYRRYFEAYEYLMKSLGGRPHWAKQHSMSQRDLLARYPKLQEWLQLRSEVDPRGMFTTEYHKRHLLSQESDNLGVYSGMAGRHFKARL